MALKKKFRVYDSAYHRITGSFVSRKGAKIEIQTQVFPSQKATELEGNRVADSNYRIKKPLLIQGSYSKAEQYYKDNDKELQSMVNAEIKNIEKYHTEELQKKSEDKVKPVKLSQQEKRRVRERVLNRAIAQKAEQIGSEIWEKIQELKNQILTAEYEILKLLNEFEGAEDI